MENTFSLKDMQSINWVDITGEFKNAAEKLKLGELVHDEMFGLYDAMAAIELMDPKMDAGMVGHKNKKPYKFEEMVQNNMIKIDGFTVSELIGIIDDTYSCLVTWLDGHSLAQTVFINVFLHQPKLIEDKTLKTFSIVILKIVDMIINFLLQALVFEEEDFHPKNYGFDLASCVGISKIVPMIKVIEDDIHKEIVKLSPTDDADQLNHYEALLTRIKFTRCFFTIFYTFKKYLYAQNALPHKQFVVQFAENLKLCHNLFDRWMETIDLGIKPSDNVNSDSKNPDYPTIIGFEPLINQRLLSPSFPRYTRLKSRHETVYYLKEFLQRLQKMLRLSEIENFIDVLRFFNEFSMHQPSCVVSRSLLQLYYMPQANKVFGEMDFVKIIMDSCKQFLKPPSLSGKITIEQNTKDILEAFFRRCILFFKNVIQIYGHNRASQRGSWALVLKDLIVLNEECASLEQYLSNSTYCDYLQVWIIFYKFYLISQYLMSGFELELYSVHEFIYMYFELEHIWDYLALILKRASEVYLEHEHLLNNTSNSSLVTNKTRKKQKAKIRNKSNMHDVLIIYFQGMKQMASAFHRLLVVFRAEEKIKPLTASLNTEQTRYNHRFSPLLKMEGTLQTHQKFSTNYCMLVNTRGGKQLYQESLQFFEQARNHFEAIKEKDYQNEVQSYVKVAKTNIVVLRLILSGHHDQGRIGFSFSETPYFPIIRFSK